MGVGWLGFAKGASHTALDSITAREEEEAKEKLLKLQEKLRRETAEYDRGQDEVYKVREEVRVLGRPKTEDYEGEDAFMRDSLGREVTGTRRKLTAEQKKARADQALMDGYKLEGERLGLDVKRGNIRESAAEVEYKRKAGNAIGRRDSLDPGAGDKANPEMAAQAVINANPTVYKSLVDLGWTPESIFQAATQAVIRADAKQKNGLSVSATAEFNDMAKNLRTKAKDYTTRTGKKVGEE